MAAGFSRRQMLKIAGSTSLSLGVPGRVLALFEDGSKIVQDHFVPANKNLSSAWTTSLTERGQKEVWSGDELESIGMPVGGIAAGQMYLCGDGTLGCWEIFNKHEFLSYGATNYAKRAVGKPVESGFVIETGGSRRALDKSGFSQISFRGEHPTATIDYSDKNCPLTVSMTVFSPFIPLNSKDSALPATFFEIKVSNPSSSAVDFKLSGLLENAVSKSGEKNPGNRKRRTVIKSTKDSTMLVHSADSAVVGEFVDVAQPRNPILVSDFESSTYGNWTSSGEAFGPGPSQGTLPDQNPVSNYEGKSLVNTFFKGDSTTGKLTSPTFDIKRKFLNFRIGGGNQPDLECINLLVGGAIVRSATGLNDERLLWESWDVSEFEGRSARIEIVDAATGGWGHINIDQIEMADKVRSRDDLIARRGNPNRDHGTLALAVLSPAESQPDSEYGFSTKHVGSLTTPSIRLEPGQSQTVSFVLTWHFPNHSRGRQYANWFADAGKVARYCVENHKRLVEQTYLWRDTYYDSTLPYWLLDRLHSTIGNLATGTTEWWGSGRFWAWEGVVCCSGTCTHVWNYEHALARLWPDIERNVRERQDFGEGFDAATGLVGFRSDRNYAADGQCGTVLKAYREHLLSSDDAFLKRNWARIKKALEFLIGRDANSDGVLEDSQPNTYDIDFFGGNTFVGSLYLAALRAGEEMATELGESQFALQCRELFESGRKQSVSKLWNGEYFIQDVDQGVYKEFQYGPGCLSDQLFGQGWAHQVGLGHLYPSNHVKKALASVWKYNWASDVTSQNKKWPPERQFAVPGEAGLFICTWPNGGREKDPVRYRDEVWTGIEYQVAGHMVWEGMVEEGLSICKAVHERYHPSKRNPYNEVECSDHYARALASWGVLTGLSGFEHHGPKKRIAFAPKVTKDNFRSVFTTAEGWGSYQQDSTESRQRFSLKLAYGKLVLREISLSSERNGQVVARLGTSVLKPTAEWNDGRLTLSFDHDVELRPGKSMTIEVKTALSRCPELSF